MNKLLKEVRLSFKRDSRTARFIVVAIILASIPIVFMLGLLVKYSVNTPFWDQWEYVNLMSKVHAGTLSFNDLWMQHNEHRSLVPRLLTIGLGELTGWNFRVPVLTNWLFVSSTYLIMLLMLSKTFVNRKVFACLAIAFAWIMFSPIQWINWIWGFQLAFFMASFFIVLSIWLLSREDVFTVRKIFILTLLSASIATYCNGNGLIVWPVGLGLILWNRAPRPILWQWLGVGVVICGSYLYKFHRSADSLPLLTVIREPIALTKYVLTYLGRNFATTQNSSQYVGLALIIIFVASLVFLYKQKSLRVVSVWIALASYSLITALLAAVSRLNFGFNHAFIAYSYTSISLTFILAVLVLVSYSYCVWFKSYSRKQLGSYVSGFIALGILVALPIPAFLGNYSKGVASLEDLGRHFKKVQNCVYTARTDNDECLSIIYPDKNQAWKDIIFLRSDHWADF